MESTRASEVERENRESALENAARAALKMKAEQEVLAAQLEDADRKVKRMQQELEAFEKRRTVLDGEEMPLLEQEVRLVEQRSALESRESKLHSDLRAFGEHYRPAPAGAAGGSIPPARRAQSYDAGGAGIPAARLPSATPSHTGRAR